MDNHQEEINHALGVCVWAQDGDETSDLYDTDCGHYFMINDGTPTDNGLAFCCYCGKKLEQLLIDETHNGG